MGITGTIHPPAGATALLAVTDDRVARLGWTLLPFVLTSSAVMLLVALFVNNIQRKFPLHWWASGEVGSFWARRQTAGEPKERWLDTPTDKENCEISQHEGSMLMVSKDGISIPSSVYLKPEDKLWLEGFVERMQKKEPRKCGV